MEYSFYNTTSTVTHTTANTLARRYSIAYIEVPVKRKELCGYTYVYVHMHRCRSVTYFPSLCLDFWASATEILGDYMTFKYAEAVFKHHFLTFMLCSLTCLLFLPVVSNWCVLSKTRFLCLPSLNLVTENVTCNIPEWHLFMAMAYTSHLKVWQVLSTF